VLHWLTAQAEGLSGFPAYALVATLVFAETALFVGFVIPGETAMLVGGFLAVHDIVSLPVVLVVAAVAAITGDGVGFVIGRWLGPRFRHGRVARRLGPERWAKSESLLNRMGGKAVFAARFVTVARAVVPTLAGASSMRYRTFLPWNAAGGVAWAGAAVLLGYAAGNSLDAADHYLHLAWIPVVVIAAAMWGWHRYFRRRAEAEPASNDLDAPTADGSQANGTTEPANGSQPGAPEPEPATESDRPIPADASLSTASDPRSS
jgi:membrane protein DedA with SNARE-associated domain